MPEERWAERAYRLVELVGRPVVDDAVAHVEYATVDSIRHFARAYGDGNPLYSDPAYAAAGPWRGLVAPPLFPIAAGVPAPPGDGPPAVDVGALLGGSEPTVLSDSWTLHRPIAEGTRLDRVSLLMAVRAGPARSPEPIDVTIRRQYLAEGRLYATQDRVRRYAPARPGRSGIGSRGRSTRPRRWPGSRPTTTGRPVGAAGRVGSRTSPPATGSVRWSKGP